MNKIFNENCLETMKQIDNEVEQNLGKYTKGMPGLF